MKNIKTALLFLGIVLSILPFSRDAHAEKRVALVIGNSAYEHISPLANPKNDARLIALVLKRLNFEVLEYSDAGYRAMKRAIKAFMTKLRKSGPDTVGLFFYAGHGLQISGVNYLVPVNAEIGQEGDVDIDAISTSSLMASLGYAGNRLNIIILDACRNNPYRSAFRSAKRGLARLDAPKGTLVAFATAPGEVASDGKGARNSPYSQALAEALVIPGLTVEQAFKEVFEKVDRATSGRQVPWYSSSVKGYFYPAGELGGQTAKLNRAKKNAPGKAAWDAIKGTKSVAVLNAFLKKYPESNYSVFALARLQELRTTAKAPSPKTPAVKKGSRRAERPGADKDVWISIKDSHDPDDFEVFLTQFPNSVYAPYARKKFKKYLSTSRNLQTAPQNDAARQREQEAIIKNLKAQQELERLRRSIEQLKGAMTSPSGNTPKTVPYVPPSVPKTKPKRSTSCHDLWMRRNRIFKNKGYCFKTSKGKRYFGNRGCWTSNPRLSRSEKRTVNSIVRQEKRKGCR